MLQFLTADFALAAFLGNDLLDRQAASLEFQLSPLAAFCFLPYGLYEVSPAQDPLVRLLLLSFSAPGKDLGPATETTDQAAARQFRYMPLIQPLGNRKWGQLYS